MVKRPAGFTVQNRGKKRKLNPSGPPSVARGKRRASEQGGGFRAKPFRTPEPVASARGKRSFDSGGDVAAKRRRVGPQTTRGGGVGFTTKGGKRVSFQPSGKRRAALLAKIRAGDAKCMVNPNTGRAVREGSSAFKKLARAKRGATKAQLAGMSVQDRARRKQLMSEERRLKREDAKR